MSKICAKCQGFLKEKGIVKEIESFHGRCDCCKSKDEEISENDMVNYLNKLLHFAIERATKEHFGQFDKAGVPYILHPLAVMNLIKEDDLIFNLSCKIVAILHDIIEDTKVTKEYLSIVFPSFIVEAVDILSKKEGQSKNSYFKEVKSNRIARVVKLADLTHNMDISRIKKPTEKDYKRVEVYKEKYAYLIK